MKYEKPELTALTHAISAIQLSGSKPAASNEDGPRVHPISCYEDAE
jgi:hypothetical protein